MNGNWRGSWLDNLKIEFWWLLQCKIGHLYRKTQLGLIGEVSGYCYAKRKYYEHVRMFKYDGTDFWIIGKQWKLFSTTPKAKKIRPKVTYQ